MKKIIFTLLILTAFIGCVYAQNIEINSVEFELPSKYSNGELYNDIYRLDNQFSIRCIDDNVPEAIGLWAEEAESQDDLNIGSHPVRHYVQYNRHVNGNHSHAYFTSGKSAYEISWTGCEITEDIKNLIEKTPKSEIDDDTFYNVLNESYRIYKQEKIDRLNKDSEYNYIEAKYSNQKQDSNKFRQILITYNNKHS